MNSSDEVLEQKLRDEIVELVKDWVKKIHKRCAYSGAGPEVRALVDAAEKLTVIEGRLNRGGR